MSVVLWGARKGDVHYNSRAFWRRNIPIDPAVSGIMVESTAFFDVGTRLDMHGIGGPPYDRGQGFTVAGIEGNTLGVRA